MIILHHIRILLLNIIISLLHIVHNWPHGSPAVLKNAVNCALILYVHLVQTISYRNRSHDLLILFVFPIWQFIKIAKTVKEYILALSLAILSQRLELALLFAICCCCKLVALVFVSKERRDQNKTFLDNENEDTSNVGPRIFSMEENNDIVIIHWIHSHFFFKMSLSLNNHNANFIKRDQACLQDHAYTVYTVCSYNHERLRPFLR